MLKHFIAGAVCMGACIAVHAQSDSIHRTENYPTFDSSRVLPSPLPVPPFPSSDYPYGEPLVGMPEDAADGFLQKALGTANNKSRIKIYGWIDPSVTFGTSKKTNIPMSYAIQPNSLQLSQAVLRIEREPNTVQTDHFDWGFRLSNVYGMDYRYTVAKGWFSNNYFDKNRQYGYDPVEAYGMLYFPKIAKGTIVKIGRFISPVDIEAQLAVNNYLYTHSVMFSYDPYTFTGVQANFKLSKRVQLVAGIHGGSDMAAWDKSAQLNGQLLLRWVSENNNNSLWGGINSLGSGKYKNYHDNKQHIAITWSHRFDSTFHMMTEAYYQWQRDAYTGGSPSFGPIRYDAGGGPGAFIPGVSRQIGFVNYTQMLLSPKAFLSLRNDFFEDPQGEQTGVKTSYFSHTFGLNYFFTKWIQIRPEIRYDWNSTFSLIGEDYVKTKPYDANSSDPKGHQFTFSMDMIVRF
ncbi:outer membrane beta-barrel protein [Rhizosphaericola mali]|uniref:Outer membrane beta-barrel protein n=1 Tax=Rhizosphaericola mali TaxID=2545455 RepID=A0A5P2FXZ8_9BACT|nr:outer membrane beta-barrel protein [Rhizosphaericola mali]QES88366.1 outer membrane beta-barrel protein [Rhizosphaericola mali]